MNDNIPPWADPEGGGQGVRPPPPSEKSQKYRVFFVCNTGLGPLKNHKATKPAYKVGPASARQGNAISMAFR